jgi:hypothetical protein
MYPLLYPLPAFFAEKRRQSGDKYPLRKSLSSIIQSACRKIGCNYQVETTRHKRMRETFAVSGVNLLKDTIPYASPKGSVDTSTRGNKAEIFFLFVSTLFPLAVVCRAEEEI